MDHAIREYRKGHTVRGKTWGRSNRQIVQNRKRKKKKIAEETAMVLSGRNGGRKVALPKLLQTFLATDQKDLSVGK